MVWQDNIIEYDAKEKLFVPQRTQPPHIGHISMLEAACNNADEVIIGIGSANKIDSQNPYFAIEREMMLRKSLEDKALTNYRFVHMPDFNNDRDWLDYVLKNAGLSPKTKVVSGNPWVEQVFGERGYGIVKPEEIISGDLIDISATKLREMIVQDNPLWRSYAATGTKHYFERFGGKERIAKFYSE
ncbi:adenylyltransferase/cytidyltransferase family protein [Candidatus Woesearchaeota archaeon]|nr:adenylyltransferase/cytidyltransferase family protein [Nanoarchaeota archaeon]MCB9370246.1 adenylyltransferase/cytidyltransferase family protein [Candidatus Woesearchaeota archaeon]USN44771.1 MAG: adenylyltransferase/cytidyltransferase family protein [Candidatus Woesearchaeota archaeon]